MYCQMMLWQNEISCHLAALYSELHNADGESLVVISLLGIGCDFGRLLKVQRYQ